MKNVYSFIFFNVLIVGCGTTLFGQTGFDVKKHKKIDVNTSSLNAGHTNGAKSNSNGRSITSGTIVKNSRQLMRPIAGQPGPKVHYSKETGLPSFIVSNGNRIGSSIPGARKDSRAATFEYLTELKDVLQVENPDETFFIDNISVGKDSKTHVRMSQLYHGVPVYGSEVVVHLNASGTGEAFNGKYINIKDKIEVIPAISNQVAVQRVSSNLQLRTRLHALSKDERRLVEFADPKVTLCIYQDKGLVKSSVLAYHIIYYPSILERWEYFVDATTGSVLHQFESTCGADGPRTATGTDLNGVSRSINTYQIGTSFILIDASRVMFNPAASTFPDEPAGGIMTIDMNNTFGDDQTVKHVVSANNAWTNQTQARALSAHFNAGIAYEYFRSKHNRPSIDGDNGTIISIVNVPDEDGTALDNAFWNGKAMFYGNGKNEFKPLAGAMDVAGHELTHGVVQNTANLEYQGESGAINESMADVFGTMMDPADWTLGEDVVKIASFPSGALRSMSDPHNGGTSLSSPGYQPSHTDEQYKGTQDNGGVHINSGIPNHAFYLYATAITRDKAAAVYYKALSENLTKSSQFIDLRLAVIKAATDLYGAASNEVTQAGIAFDAVGISDGDGGDYTPTLPNNPGTEYLLIYNTTTSNPKTLYRTTADNPTNNPVALTDIEFLSRPSVTDQGDVAVFVADDHTIHVIETTPGSVATERILQDEEIWSNVVVSKGGSKIAAVTSGQDAKIWVYDFGLDDWNSFDLYNPTYSEGVTTAGPLYADALEWDYTGQYLVYDCFNQIDNASDPNAIAIEYWDVNFIHVWDNAAKNFADGTIEKLFSSLPDGVSIGNPSFAKNSPNVLAFDYVNEKTEEYQIVGCNIETNDVKSIVENNTLGWPSYNKTDQRLAFTTTGSVDDYDAHYIALAGDKISPSAATSTLLIDGAKWPVYFAFGERSTGDEVIEIVTDVPEEIGKESLVECYPNPVQKEVVIQTGDPSLLSGKIVIVNSIGQQVYSMPVQALDDKHAIVDVEHLKTGQYFMRISGARKSAGCTLYKK